MNALARKTLGIGWELVGGKVEKWRVLTAESSVFTDQKGKIVINASTNITKKKKNCSAFFPPLNSIRTHEGHVLTLS